jgi:hypothetical protein
VLAYIIHTYVRRNVIQREAEKKLKYKCLKYRNSANMENELLCHANNHWGHGNSK